MKKSTLDLLDSEYKKKESYYRNLESNYRRQASEEKFIIEPEYWEEYYKKLSVYTFSWQEFKFSEMKDLDTEITQNDIGLYMFVVKANQLICDMPKFVIYVGISGEKGSNRSLKDRLKDYFNFNKVKKRNKLHRLISKYYSNIYINYCFPTKNYKDLENIEEYLHGFFYPICNDRDFPIGIKKTKGAF